MRSTAPEFRLGPWPTKTVSLITATFSPQALEQQAAARHGCRDFLRSRNIRVSSLALAGHSRLTRAATVMRAFARRWLSDPSHRFLVNRREVFPQNRAVATAHSC